MISLLCPTYKRPKELQRMIDSARATASEDIEIVYYIDEDDRSYDQKMNYSTNDQCIYGPKIPISDMWNRCQEIATGDIYMQCADDITFNTPGWDVIVENTFASIPDRIAFVFGDDTHPSRGKVHGTHGFVSKEWVDTLKYFLPPGYVADWSDQWLNDVAESIGRKIFVPIVTEHHHAALGKAEWDETYLEANEKREKEHPEIMYIAEDWRREIDIALLKDKINEKQT